MNRSRLSNLWNICEGEAQIRGSIKILLARETLGKGRGLTGADLTETECSYYYMVAKVFFFFVICNG